MVLMVIRWPFSSEGRFQSHVIPCEIRGGRSGNGAVLLRVPPFSPTGTTVFPCQWRSTNSLYSSWSTWCSYQMDKRAKPGNLPTSSAVSEIGDNSIEKWFYLEICLVIYFLFYSDLLFTLRPLLLRITSRKASCALPSFSGGSGGFVW